MPAQERSLFLSGRGTKIFRSGSPVVSSPRGARGVGLGPDSRGPLALKKQRLPGTADGPHGAPGDCEQRQAHLLSLAGLLGAEFPVLGRPSCRAARVLAVRMRASIIDATCVVAVGCLSRPGAGVLFVVEILAAASCKRHRIESLRDLVARAMPGSGGADSCKPQAAGSSLVGSSPIFRRCAGLGRDSCPTARVRPRLVLDAARFRPSVVDSPFLHGPHSICAWVGPRRTYRCRLPWRGGQSVARPRYHHRDALRGALFPSLGASPCWVWLFACPPRIGADVVRRKPSEKAQARSGRDRGRASCLLGRAPCLCACRFSTGRCWFRVAV